MRFIGIFVANLLPLKQAFFLYEKDRPEGRPFPRKEEDYRSCPRRVRLSAKKSLFFGASLIAPLDIGDGEHCLIIGIIRMRV